jgi:DNA-binding ferritin-like protein
VPQGVRVQVPPLASKQQLGGDPTTADLYNDIARVADKRLWFLEAHIQLEE